MKQELWRRAEDAFHGALERPPGERAAFLDATCGADLELREYVDRLLSKDEQAGAFLEQPVFAAFASGPRMPGSLAGRRRGSYQVLSLLGAGGMGEVYRARDDRLEREVALKVLPPEFASDPARITRFRREARALAALNHPNIATIHELEESEEGCCLVLELVEGDTPRGPLPLAPALDIALQVAEALKAAHEHGIIHRDLKPANIRVTPEGRVKVLDFGLAKAICDSEVDSTADAAPNVMIGSTWAGHVLGTPGYMSPEQARGEQVDQRTDIWAFGCLLYELLTGKRAFASNCADEPPAAVHRHEPDWQALPAGTPPSIRSLLRACLQKDANLRPNGVAAALIAIRKAQRRSHAWWFAAASLIVLVAAAASWLAATRLSRHDQSPQHFAMTMPGPAVLGRLVFSNLAITSDGTGVAYVGSEGGRSQLYWHDLHGHDGWPLPGTEEGNTPFLSPDGRWLGFHRNGRLLRKALHAGRVTDGSQVTEVARTPLLRGAAWSDDGTIVYGALHGGLWRVAAAGGTPERLTEPDVSASETDHRWPYVLPDGRHILFTIEHASFREERAAIAVLSLDTRKITKILSGFTYARYLPSGHLVVGRNGTLFAVPFNLNTMKVTAPPTAVLQDVSSYPSGNVFAFDVARNGTAVYASEKAEMPRNSFVWVTRDGDARHAVPDRLPYSVINFALSPDGRRVATTVSDPRYDYISISNLDDQTSRRLDVEADCHAPVWSPDGSRLAFGSNRDGPLNLYIAAADNERGIVRVGTSGTMQRPRSWSPDGRFLAFEAQTPVTPLEIHLLDINRRLEWRWGPAGVELSQPSFSPDGRWLAYQSLESGRWEVWVRPFAGAGESHRVSGPNGGVAPTWVGKEIFYLERADDTRIMSRRVNSTSPLRFAATPTVAFALPFALGNENPHMALAYDIEPGGRRALVVQPDPRAPQRISALNVITNWPDEVQALLRRKR